MRPRESEAPRPRTYPPSSFPTPLRRSTRPLPAPIPPETPEVGRRRGSPRRSVPRSRGQGTQRGHEGAQKPQGARGRRQSAFLLTGPAVPHPGTASKDRSGRREQERGTVGKRGFRGLKGQAGKTDGRGPTVEAAKVGVRNARLDGRQDLKGVQELGRQLRGEEGVPARERLKFICAWTVRTPSARPPPREPRRTETGSRVCWDAPGAGRAGGEESRGSASVLPSRAAVLELGWGWQGGWRGRPTPPS